MKVCIAVVSLEKEVNWFTIIVIIIGTHHHRRHHCRPLSWSSLSFLSCLWTISASSLMYSMYVYNLFRNDWTILYYTRYVAKLSTRSLSYLCPDLPLLLENTTTVVVSGSRPLARGLLSNVIKLRYVSTRAHSFAQTHTHLHSSEQLHVCVGAIINVFNQTHYRWCHKTNAASTCHNINGPWMFNATGFNQQLRLFLAIPVLLCFIQIVYNLETYLVRLL